MDNRPKRLDDMSKPELEEWVLNTPVQAQEAERRCNKMVSPLEQKIMVSVDEALQEVVTEEIRNRISPDDIAEQVVQSLALGRLVDEVTYEVEQEIVKQMVESVEKSYTSDDISIEEIVENLLNE